MVDCKLCPWLCASLCVWLCFWLRARLCPWLFGYVHDCTFYIVPDCDPGCVFGCVPVCMFYSVPDCDPGCVFGCVPVCMFECVPDCVPGCVWLRAWPCVRLCPSDATYDYFRQSHSIGRWFRISLALFLATLLLLSLYYRCCVVGNNTGSWFRVGLSWRTEYVSIKLTSKLVNFYRRKCYWMLWKFGY